MTTRGGGAKFWAWWRIARLQFYPMTWLAYTLGAVLQSSLAKKFYLSFYLVGYLILFLMELCTILVNEYFDYETDSQNKNYSMFTGGTRVLVDGSLSFKEVRIGIALVLFLIFCFSLVLNRITPFNAQLITTLLIALGIFLGLGYTMPPFKFCYRGSGEIVVSLTHSIYVILCGFVFQGGAWNDPRPWIISIPLFFSIFAAITLAGIPDRSADKMAGKRTMASLFGPRNSLRIAIWCIIMAYLSALLLGEFNTITIVFLSLNLLVLPHCAMLVYYLFKLMKTGFYEERINREMGMSLSYIIWFGLIPLFSLAIKLHLLPYHV